MDPVVLGLLVPLGLIITVFGTLWFVYRRHLRLLRRAGRRLDPLSPLTAARRRPVTFSLPPRWLAIRTSNIPFLREVLQMRDEPPASWAEALSRARERLLFVSAPVDGWVIVIGNKLPDPVQDIDATYRFLQDLSKNVGEVHYYHTDRVLNFHAWARLQDGTVGRAYAWAGETLWNEGRTSLDERLLGLKCRAYAEEVEPPKYGELSREQQNTERVVLLARRWSIDPVAASEILLQQEAVESDDEWPE